MRANTMIFLLYFNLLVTLGWFIFVGLDADCIDFIGEKRQREGIMEKLYPITADGCVEMCEQFNSCFAVNYFRLNATCQLLNRTMPESKLIKATKCMYKAVRSPPQELIDNDPCYQKVCPWDEICTHNITTNMAECFPFCKTHPFKSGAINETVKVEVGQTYTYRCQDDLFKKGDQNPTVTCLQDGSWTSTNFICVKQNWKQDTIYPNNIHKSELISTLTMIDLLDCMKQCDDNQNICLSFFYDNYTRRCLLSSSFRRGLPQGLQLSDGLVYYTAPSTTCDMEYRNVSLGDSYFCIKLYGVNKLFNEAMKICESERAKLLVVTTKNQIDDVKKLFGHDLGYAFLGLSDEAYEGEWVSWDGQLVSPFWSPQGNEPNGGRSENCGSIVPSKSGIVDYRCGYQMPFLCCKSNM